ncbi:MAG: DUF4349 domain-containing protein [Hamadaea sp.]|uniref:DUF4349 domain-containing protein n=1 Tax=Hamadaea sp. TaxID=2024425 RepID=UPI0017F428C1|nr:DUF4349 domain-containing protein [Hamadaea sp.]NUR47757.1 DUF4349 domain-containing protein [Hamadaea sp.]NUR72293.1 DUF4349 domain-containing protein [Hamadaea sp.]NUT23249.1 DUF4349 domain-containing protein [Hamadaea sp.]
MLVRRKTVALALAGLALVFVAGCGASDKNSSDSGGAAPAVNPEGVGDLGAKTANGADQSTTSGQGSGQVPEVGRAIVYNGQITVRVDDVELAAQRVRSAATGVGGFVGSEKSTSGGSRAQSSITIRVPADKFDSVLADAAKLGKELDRSVNAEDVTATVVDLEARIKAQQASVDSVRRMFAQATKLTEIVQLEQELSRRQAELDALLAKQRRLDDLVKLSTITVTLVGPDTPYVEPKTEDPSFFGGLKAGWNTFVVILKVASAVLGFLLPFLIVAAVVLVPLWWLLRRRRTARPVAVDQGVKDVDTPTDGTLGS